MKLILGLGNPGSQYQNTRHNFGFLALDEFQSEAGFSSWQENAKFKAILSESETNGQKIILAKPQTFMNLSGQSAALIANFYKIEPADIWVVHDDIDLPLGSIRIGTGSGAAGHNGIKSVIESLGTKDFVRFRLGICAKQGFLSSLFGKIPSEKFVLQNFTNSEKEIVSETTKKTAEALKTALTEGIEKAQNQFN